MNAILLSLALLGPCPNGKCARPAMRAPARVVQAAPVRKVLKARPARKLLDAAKDRINDRPRRGLRLFPNVG